MDVTIEFHIYYIKIIYKQFRDDTSDVNDFMRVYQNDIYMYIYIHICTVVYLFFVYESRKLFATAWKTFTKYVYGYLGDGCDPK